MEFPVIWRGAQETHVRMETAGHTVEETQVCLGCACVGVCVWAHIIHASPHSERVGFRQGHRGQRSGSVLCGTASCCICRKYANRSSKYQLCEGLLLSLRVSEALI